MQVPGFGSSEKVDRVDQGTGKVRARSFQIGDTVVFLHNVGTISMIDGSQSPWPIVLGVILIVIGLGTFALVKALGVIVLLGAIALLVWGARRKPDIYLSIGTSDGKRTNIVSKDRPGLLAFRNLLREILDEEIFGTGTVTVEQNKVTYNFDQRKTHIEAERITGGITTGDHSPATGADSTINELER